MTKKIRKGVFETNSSSTHSICIAKEATLTIPKKLKFGFGEFGWEEKTLKSTEEKASYIYTALIYNEMFEEKDKILKFLTKDGIKLDVEEPIYENKSYTDSDGNLVSYKSWTNSVYVDHADELKEFLEDLAKSKNKLFNYLFSDLSFIRTGNDNDDSDISINVKYEHDHYYKGN